MTSFRSQPCPTLGPRRSCGVSACDTTRPATWTIPACHRVVLRRRSGDRITRWAADRGRSVALADGAPVDADRARGRHRAARRHTARDHLVDKPAGRRGRRSRRLLRVEALRRIAEGAMTRGETRTGEAHRRLARRRRGRLIRLPGTPKVSRRSPVVSVRGD